MILRFAIINRGCENCREVMKSVNIINMRVPRGRGIEVYDNYREEEFDIRMFPIIDRIKEEFEDYPFIYLDGIIIFIKPAMKELLTAYFNKFFKDELIIDNNMNGR